MVHLALLIDIIAGEDTTNNLLADWLNDNQIHALNVEVERLTDELNLAHEALRRAFSPQ